MLCPEELHRGLPIPGAVGRREPGWRPCLVFAVARAFAADMEVAAAAVVVGAGRSNRSLGAGDPSVVVLVAGVLATWVRAVRTAAAVVVAAERWVVERRRDSTAAVAVEAGSRRNFAASVRESD